MHRRPIIGKDRRALLLRLGIVDRFVFRWKDDLQRLAIIRPTKNGMANAGRLNPARTFITRFAGV